MENILNAALLSDHAERALITCLDYISQNRIYSTWTKKNTGWQEQWLQSKFAGLYATCNALSLLVHYADRYGETITSAIEELKYMFDSHVDYSENNADTPEEKTRKARCRLLLEQNCHTTLKAVYFLKTYELLKKYGITVSHSKTFLEIVEAVYNQVERAFDPKTGYFSPAVGNTSDVSILTTMQTFILLKDRDGTSSSGIYSINQTKQLFIQFINEYISYMQERTPNTKNKFNEYAIKSSFVAALYALSHSLECLDTEEKALIVSALFISMNDQDIRSGFFIKDSYTVPETVIARDTYTADARILYLQAAIQLIHSGVMPPITIEYFIDDIEEIIETSMLKKQYLSWDSVPSFSHNIRGLTVLRTLVNFLKQTEFTFTAYKVSPQIHGFKYRMIEPMSVVLFMSFSKEYSESVQASVNEVLSYVGFNVWCATNDPYDVFVVDSILDRLTKAQFAIIDCSERGANVMYETGLTHGLGKPALLCGSSDEVFPYENAEYFDTCIFNSNGEVNPPPYRDLQKGILEYIVNNINVFCLTDLQKDDIICKANSFLAEYCK